MFTQFLGQIQASLVAQMVKNLPAMQEIQVWFLGQEDPLEEDMETHSSTFAWRIPGTDESGRLQSMGHKESDTTGWLTLSLTFSLAQILACSSCTVNI